MSELMHMVLRKGDSYIWSDLYCYLSEASIVIYMAISMWASSRHPHSQQSYALGSREEEEIRRRAQGGRGGGYKLRLKERNGER